MSFMDILKNKKEDDESKLEKTIRQFKEILEDEKTYFLIEPEKESLLRNLYKDLNNYFLRGGYLPKSYSNLIEADRDNNEKKLYRLFKKLGIKQKNKYATKEKNREAFNSYINFTYDSKLTELEPIIKKLKASNTKSLLDAMEDSELSILFSPKNKILVLELISRIAILEDDIKEDTTLQGSKILSEAKDTLESNLEIIMFLYNALDAMATISKVPSYRVSDRSVTQLQKDLEYINTRGIVLDSSLSLPEEKMDLLKNLYKKKLDNPKSFKITQSPSGGGKLVVDENAKQRAKKFKENVDEELIKISAEIKKLTEVENKFEVYKNLRNRISDSIADNSEGKDIERTFKQDAEMERIEEDVTDKINSLTETLEGFLKEKEGLSEEDKYSDEYSDKTLKFFEDREAQDKELENLMKTYIELVEKNIIPYKLKFGSDKGEYSQRTKFKETKPKLTTEQLNPKTKDGEFVHRKPYDSGDYDSFSGDYFSSSQSQSKNISQDIKELEEIGKDWLANYGLSKTKVKLPRRAFGERIDAEKYKRILSEKEPKKPSNTKESSSFIPQRKYTEKDKKGKLVRRKKLPKGLSAKKPKYTTEQARYLYSGKPPSKKDKK